MSAPGDWMKSPSWEAFTGHALAGYGVLLTARLFTASWLALSLATWLFVCVVLLKEYFIDLRYESGEDVRSSTIDALEYAAGHAVAWLVVVLHHWFP